METPPPGGPSREAQGDDAIDPATLPPIESLGPESDYTVFLRKGVPEALRIAALRKAWISDPFIRDFRGPAEYAIDYTTSEFNLRPTDDVAKMLDQILPPRPAAAGETQPAAAKPGEPPPPAPTAVADVKPDPAPALNLPQKQAALPEPQQSPQPAASKAPLLRRKHGGALPDTGD